MFRNKFRSQKSRQRQNGRFGQFLKSKWNLLYLVLAALVLFSLFSIPKIAVSAVERTRGRIVTVESP